MEKNQQQNNNNKSSKQQLNWHSYSFQIKIIKKKCAHSFIEGIARKSTVCVCVCLGVGATQGAYEVHSWPVK